MLQPGQLVKSGSLFGIVTDLAPRTVLLGNGCEMILSEVDVLENCGELATFPELVAVWQQVYHRHQQIVLCYRHQLPDWLLAQIDAVLNPDVPTSVPDAVTL